VKKGRSKNAVKQASFIRLEAHYGFEAVFCNVASGWEKSNVENAVATLPEVRLDTGFTCIALVHPDLRGMWKHIHGLVFLRSKTQAGEAGDVPSQGGRVARHIYYPSGTAVCAGLTW